MADHVILLAGRVVAQGTFDELKDLKETSQGITEKRRFAGGTDPTGQDNFTHVDIRLRDTVSVLDAAAKNRIDAPLTSPFSVFTDQEGVDTESVALHEIGHALGLGHPDVEVQKSAKTVLSPWVKTPTSVAYVNEDNMFGLGDDANLKAPPYEIHNQSEGTTSALMDSLYTEGSILRSLTPDELGGIAAIYGADDARNAASALAAGASISFGPKGKLSQSIVVEKDIHRRPPSARQVNDKSPIGDADAAKVMQTITEKQAFVGNLYTDDPRDHVFIKLPMIPTGKRQVLLLVDIDEGRQSESFDNRSGDLRLEVFNELQTVTEFSFEAKKRDPGSVFQDDPFIALKLEASDFVVPPEDADTITPEQRGRLFAAVSRALGNEDDEMDYALRVLGGTGPPPKKGKVSGKALGDFSGSTLRYDSSTDILTLDDVVMDGFSPLPGSLSGLDGDGARGGRLSLPEFELLGPMDDGFVFAGGIATLSVDGITLMSAELPFLLLDDSLQGRFGYNLVGQFIDFEFSDAVISEALSELRLPIDPADWIGPQLYVSTELTLTPLVQGLQDFETVTRFAAIGNVPAPPTLTLVAVAATLLLLCGSARGD